MGTEITRDEFEDRDYARFRERLEQNLSELRRLLERPGFGAGPATIGAELELSLVDGSARPLPVNQAVRATVADHRIALELNRFNLELNSSPVPLTGPGSRPFTALAGEQRAEHGFYRAAQYGLAADLPWPSRHGHQVRTLPASRLVTELLPAARQGLVDAGVAAAEADRLLDVIGARAANGQTGAAWQRAALAAARRDLPAEQALTVMLDRYLSHAATNQPVHTWPEGEMT